MAGENAGVYNCMGAMTFEEIAERLALDAAWAVLRAEGCEEGSDDEIAERLAELAAGFLITRERVRQILNAGLRKLKRKRGAVAELRAMAAMFRHEHDRRVLDRVTRRDHGGRSGGRSARDWQKSNRKSLAVRRDLAA